MNEQNPLTGYFRQTKISAPLPTKGNYYPEGIIKVNANGEVDVKAMTAADELALKNPDALLNGQGMIDVMKSCVPNIIGDAGQLLVPDVTVIMLAIRYATEGDTMKFEVACPKCGTENSFERSIRASFDYINFLDDEYVVELRENLSLSLRPHTFNTSTKNALTQFEQAKIIQLINSDDVPEEERIRSFGQSFNKMVNMNFDLVSESIKEIRTEDTVVTKRHFINEFIRELEKSEIDALRTHIRKLNETGVPTYHDCVCENQECKHEWREEGVQFDPSHFFE